MSTDPGEVRAKRIRARAARLHARRLEEVARSLFDGLIVLAATAVGLTVGHGAEWVATGAAALVVVLVGRAIAMWVLITPREELLEAIDSYAATIDSLEKDRLRAETLVRNGDC